MGKIISIIKYEFTETIRRPKILLVLFFLVVLYESDLSPIYEICKETGLSLNIFEPFVLMCTRSVNIMLIPLIFIVLISGFPNCKNDYFRMIRVSRKSWLAGEISFIFLISFAVIAVLFIGTIVPVLNISDAAKNDWSSFMTKLNETNPSIYIRNIRLTLDESITIHSLPIGAAVYSFLIMWLNLIISGLLILLGTVTSKRMIFFSSALALAFIGGCSTHFNNRIKWIFPITHTQLGLHYNSIFSKTELPIYMSYILLVSEAIAIIIACVILIGKTMFAGENQ